MKNGGKGGPSTGSAAYVEKEKDFGGRGGVATCKMSTTEEAELFLADRKDFVGGKRVLGKKKTNERRRGGRTDGWTNGRAGGRKNGRTEGQKDGQQVSRVVGGRLFGVGQSFRWACA